MSYINSSFSKVTTQVNLEQESAQWDLAKTKSGYWVAIMTTDDGHTISDNCADEHPVDAGKNLQQRVNAEADRLELEYKAIEAGIRRMQRDLERTYREYKTALDRKSMAQDFVSYMIDPSDERLEVNEL